MLRDLSNTTASNRLTLRRQSEVTTYRAKHLTSISTIAYHSHFYSHPSSPLTMNGWVKNWSRSRFLERHEAPSLAREAEGLQSAEDVIHATHETSERKEERQPSKRTRRVNKTKATPTAHMLPQRRAHPCHLQRLQHPLHQ